MLQLNFNPFPNLESERLSFRKLNNEDAPEILKLRGNAEIMKYIPRPLAKTKEDDSDIEMEGMDMEEDEAVADDYDDEALEDVTGPKTEGEEEDIKVDEHELEELEEARMERMDLMYVALVLWCCV